MNVKPNLKYLNSKPRLNDLEVILLIDLLKQDYDRSVIHACLGLNLEDDQWIEGLNHNSVMLNIRLRESLSRKKRYLFVLEQYHWQKSLQQTMVKLFGQPLLLMGICLNMITFMAVSVLPDTQRNLSSLGLMDKKQWLMGALQLGTGLQWGILMSVFIFIRFFYKQYALRIYRFLYLQNKHNLFSKLVTYRFIQQLHFGLKYTRSLQTSLEIMANDFNPVIRLISEESMHNLKMGIAVSKAIPWLDDLSYLFLGNDDYAYRIEEKLGQYLSICHQQILLSLRRIKHFMNIYVYSLAALFVISVYTLILSPLQLLENIL